MRTVACRINVELNSNDYLEYFPDRIEIRYLKVNGSVKTKILIEVSDQIESDIKEILKQNIK